MKKETLLVSLVFSIDITRRRRRRTGFQRSVEKLRKNLEDTASALSSSLEMRDAYKRQSRRVTLLACAIARKTGLSADQIDGIRIAESSTILERYPTRRDSH